MKYPILFIDSSDRKSILVDIFDNDTKIDSISFEPTRSKTDILTAIDEIIKNNKLELKDLKEIKINQGPGSFTGLRVAASIANTLAILLSIPVNGKKQVEVVYN